MKKLSVVILAAGEGTRMKSDKPKVLHEVLEVPMVNWVIASAEKLAPESIYTVIGYKRGAVKAKLKRSGVRFVTQSRQLGSGHAMKAAKKRLGTFKGDIIVLCGDIPLIKHATLKTFLNFHRKNDYDATVLSVKIQNPFGYGRIIRGQNGRADRIVEEKDASTIERKVNEINSGIYCFKSPGIWEAIEKIGKNNVKREYYITDLVGILNSEGRKVGVTCAKNANEVLGVNSREDLSRAEALAKKIKK